MSGNFLGNGLNSISGRISGNSQESMSAKSSALTSQFPRHIGIILDGNRRFAKKLNLDPWKGHEWGEKKVQKLFYWCREFDVRELTLYAFSVQNFNRPKLEFEYIKKLFMDAAKRLLQDKRLEEYNIKINFIGRLSMFPSDMVSIMNKIMDKTKHNSRYVVNFAMAYGGREEIVDAVKKLVSEAQSGEIKSEDIDEEMISKHLYIGGEPDMIIRTGGEKRTSNFLVWQSSYSEWFFLDKSWPEFEKDDLKLCIDEYMKRDRRRGV